jgi:two-component system sensor histidine kinase YesM
LNKLVGVMDYITRNIQLKPKLFTTFLLVGLLPLFIMAIYFHSMVTKPIEKGMGMYTVEITKQVVHHLDSFTDEIVRISDGVRFDPAVQYFLSMDKMTNDTTDISVITDTRKLLSQIGKSNNHLKGVFLVNDYGLSVYHADNKVMNYSYNFQEEPWFMSLKQLEKPQLMNSHPQNYIQGESVVSFVRRLTQFREIEDRGTLLLDFDIQYITQWSDNIQLGQTGSVFLFSEKGDPVTVNAADPIPRSVWKDWYQTIQAEQSGYFVAPYDNRYYMIGFSTSFNTQWKAVGIVPYDEIAGDIQNIRSAIIFIVLLAVIIIFAISTYLSFAIANPLNRLENLMKVVESGDLKTRVQWNRRDEFGRLGNRFNHMLDQVNHLREGIHQAEINQYRLELLARESDLKALQAQINPHFLYNTLNTMSCIGEIHNLEEITVISKALADMFKYSIDGYGYTELQDELFHIQSYLTIVEIRFPDRFHCHFDITEGTRQLEVLRLILQPIIEYSIAHGLVPKETEGNIWISSHIHKETLIIRVTDDGVGIPDPLFEQINAFLQKSVTTDITEHIGLLNVHRRLQLYYGPEGRLRIASSTNQGTVVELRLPLSGGDD